MILTVVVIVAILSMLNLAITLTVVRLLRQRATGTGRSSFDFKPAGLAGRTIPAKLDAAFDARQPGWSAHPGSTFVAFFAAGCPSCPDQALRFVDLDGPAGRGSDVLVMLTRGDGSTDAELLNLLGNTPVVQGPEADSIAAELGVVAFPLFVRIDNGKQIADASFNLQALTGAAGAPQHAAEPRR